jgi:antitoxin (DNA-binding transcriptional repressor) of toxin-antitoxin stability system
MGDITVSIAQFKAHLSKLLSEGRSYGKRIIIMNRKTPVATVLPYNEKGLNTQPGSGGLASLAGSWEDLSEIDPYIQEAYQERQKEGYREVSF